MGFGLDGSDSSQILSHLHRTPPSRDSCPLAQEITITQYASPYNNGFNHHSRSIHVGGRAVQINPPINQSIKIRYFFIISRVSDSSNEIIHQDWSKSYKSNISLVCSNHGRKKKGETICFIKINEDLIRS